MGYEIIECNYRCRSGEIDIIAKDSGTLVFVEVKYRSTARRGFPGEAITKHKQGKIYQVASFYILSHGLSFDSPYRFDAVLISGDKITHIKNAFGGI